MISKKRQVLAVLLAITVVLSTTSAAAVTPEPVVRRDAPADADGDGVYGGQPNGQGEAGEKNATRNRKNERDEGTATASSTVRRRTPRRRRTNRWARACRSPVGVTSRAR
jgi:hypothetical protein